MGRYAGSGAMNVGESCFATAAACAVVLLALMSAAALAPASAAAKPRPPDLGGIDLASAERCDPLDPAHCLLPWPNDHFTRRDPASDTRRRLDLARESMPRNRDGVPIEPGD